MDYEKAMEGACVLKFLMLLVHTSDIARLHNYNSDIFQIQKHSILML